LRATTWLGHDLAPALERAFGFDLDRIVPPRDSVTADGVTVSVDRYVVLTHTYSEEGSYAELEIRVVIEAAEGSVRLVTHVPSEPTTMASKGDEKAIRIVISQRSERTAPRRDRSSGE
jgi:hypothetical protein